MNIEKVPYPPSYGDIYPAVPTAEMSGHNAGWQATAIEVDPPQPPPVYVTQHPVTNVIMQDQSRIGSYPVKLQPCPHCQIECKTTIKQEATLRTHLLALVLCVTCCCCCIPFAYMTNNKTKTANHFCENCKSYIGSYNRKWCA